MTEAEWLACEDVEPMLEFLGVTASQRKLRLFAVACCRRVTDHLWAGEWSSRAVEIAERFADGSATANDLDVARSDVERRLELYPDEPVYDASYWACGREIADDVRICAFYAANNSTRVIDGTKPDPDFDEKCGQVRGTTIRSQCELLRDIFGNPFRPVTFDPAWRTSDVMPLANGIYEEKAFSAMPILADALQDAGCASEELLSHLRDANATHVRGCWALDLVLGKE